MDTSNILTIIGFSIASILLVVDIIMCDTKEVV